MKGQWYAVKLSSHQWVVARVNYETRRYEALPVHGTELRTAPTRAILRTVAGVRTWLDEDGAAAEATRRNGGGDGSTGSG